MSLRPDRNAASSRMVRSVRNSDIQSKSNTGLAPGWSPTPTPSPVRHRILPTPIAAAPSTSPWMAMRLRSRQEICSTVPIPWRTRIEQMPIDDMWQLAPEASVALIASATSHNGSAALNTSRGSPESGGFNSAVTAKSPRRSTRSRIEADLCPSGGTSGGSTVGSKGSRSWKGGIGDYT